MMTGMINWILRTAWNVAAPIHRPILRKLDRYVETRLVRAIQTDTNLVLNSLIREMARLQMQIEILQHSREERD